MGDGDVSVHADNDEVEDGGGAGPDVNTEPHEAEIPDKVVVSWVTLSQPASHLPNIQLSTTSYTAERGSTKTPSSKSATARDTMKV